MRGLLNNDTSGSLFKRGCCFSVSLSLSVCLFSSLLISPISLYVHSKLSLSLHLSRSVFVPYVSLSLHSHPYLSFSPLSLSFSMLTLCSFSPAFLSLHPSLPLSH